MFAAGHVTGVAACESTAICQSCFCWVQGKKETVAWRQSSHWASMHYNQRRCGSQHAASGWTEGMSTHGTMQARHAWHIFSKEPKYGFQEAT